MNRWAIINRPLCGLIQARLPRKLGPCRPFSLPARLFPLFLISSYNGPHLRTGLTYFQPFNCECKLRFAFRLISGTAQSPAKLPI